MTSKDGRLINIQGWSGRIRSLPVFKDFAWNEVPGESRLSEKERMLCILSDLLGCQRRGDFCKVLHMTLEAGIDPVAVKEVIYQAAA